jgi:outer membrane protein assembly factor BamB
MMHHPSVGALSLVLAIAYFSTARAEENWPQWRGPDRNGTSSATNLPTTWSLDENIVWRTPLPSWSGSSPIIWGDRIFLISPSAATSNELEQDAVGKLGRWGNRVPGGSTMQLLCISRTDGSILWQRDLDQGNRLFGKQNSSSPSPVTDGQHIWAMTGTGAVVAFDFEGNEIWKKNLQQEYGPFGLNWGYAASPLLYDGKLIIEVLHGAQTDDPSYVIAFDAASGDMLWRQERITDAPHESPDAYSTPGIFVHSGQAQIIISGADYVTGHDPNSGAEIWRLPGLNPSRASNYRVVGSPVVIDGMVYTPTRKVPLLALDDGDDGDPATMKVVWQWSGAGAPDVPTPVSDGKYFYMVEDRGLVTCLDAKTGKLVWGPERTVPGTVSSSPVLADGKLYFVNEDAATVVVKAGPEFELLATNELDETYTLSSIAVVDRQLFIRTSTHLYCIGNIAVD